MFDVEASGGFHCEPGGGQCACPWPPTHHFLSILYSPQCPFQGMRSFDIYFSFPGGKVSPSLSYARVLSPSCALVRRGRHQSRGCQWSQYLCGRRISTTVSPFTQRVAGGGVGWRAQDCSSSATSITCLEGLPVTHLCLGQQGLPCHPEFGLGFCLEDGPLSLGLSCQKPSLAPPDMGVVLPAYLHFSSYICAQWAGTWQASWSWEPLEGLTGRRGFDGKEVEGGVLPELLKPPGLYWGSVWGAGEKGCVEAM